MNFFKRIIQKPPVAFPLVALFHIGLLLYMVYNNVSDPVNGMIWVQPAILLIYTICWLWVCDMKKMAVLAYMGITTVNLVARMVVTDEMMRVYFLDALFPADIIFTIITALYYKKLD